MAAEANQHSTHHYGRLEPYGLATNIEAPSVSERIRKQLSGKPLPPKLVKSIYLDEELNGFEWDNPTFRHTLNLIAKYQPAPASTVPSTVDASAESVPTVPSTGDASAESAS